MSSVIADLELWGPGINRRPPSLREAHQYTWNLATSHYENFPVVSWAVPRKLRQDFANVYAFCRWADDLGDETGSPEKSRKLLNWWQLELEKCNQGQAEHPVYVALQGTIKRFTIPIDPFADLISAFMQDQVFREYESFHQLRDYCRRSADPVGRIVLYLAERVSSQNLALSDSICTGLQLVNFWQDVARDFKIGRIYLPHEDRLRFSYSDNMLREQRATPEFLELMRFEVDRARDFLLIGQPLVEQMPGRLLLDIDLMIRGGLLVLTGIERLNYDVWRTRPKIRKAQLAVTGLQSLAQRLMSALLRS